STATVDVYKRNFKKGNRQEGHDLKASRWFTLLFGVFAIIFAALSSLFENLIQAVNILGSIFYGTILGIFLVAFFIKFVKGNALFIAALIAQTFIIILYTYGKTT
ncbi:MAG: sodium:solute symporter, partial [Flavobacteriales bacterium]